MHSAKPTTIKFLIVLFISGGLQMTAFSQENSPYSRYGLGDITPNRNIFNRGMAGIAAGVSDYQSVNFTNPAALSNIFNTIFDVAAEADFRTLKSSNPAKKSSSANSLFSYLQMAFPLSSPAMYKKDRRWAMSFGLKPFSKINYKIEKRERLTGIDSLYTLYEGSGGANQAYVSTALKIKNFSVGVTAGYMFGNKEYSTKLQFINDTVIYYQSNSANKTTFGGIFLNAGLQYEKVFNQDAKLEVPKILRVGMYGNWQQKMRANREDIRETISFDPNGRIYRIDSIYEQKDIKGKIIIPATIGMGFSFQNAHWMYGADFETTNWNNYRYYGQTDLVKNSWMIRAGAQYYPAKQNTPSKKYFNFVRYRGGFYYGSDYIKLNTNRPDYGFTLGAGMPLTSLQRISYTGEYAVLNTALELGNRGNRTSGIRENIIRFSIGVSMNARWFQKPKYN